MKCLVSDYDQTFKTSIKNLYLNIEGIRKFRRKGNKFIIATGREFKSIKSEINKYEIEYDYLICNNGLIIFNNKDNIINCYPLSKDNIKKIYNSFKGVECNISKYNFYEHTLSDENILEIKASFDSNEIAKNHKNYIESNINNIHCDIFNKNIYIGNYTSKATAINEILKIENISKEDIYTIGDDINDLEMLEEFNGYKMLNSNKNLWFKGIPTKTQVHRLIKKINKK